MPKKRTTPVNEKHNRKKKRKAVLFKRMVLADILSSGCVFLSYCVWIDFQIRKEFDGKRWSIPARVYSQPLELYAGRRYEQNQSLKD